MGQDWGEGMWMGNVASETGSSGGVDGKVVL